MHLLVDFVGCHITQNYRVGAGMSDRATAHSPCSHTFASIYYQPPSNIVDQLIHYYTESTLRWLVSSLLASFAKAK